MSLYLSRRFDIFLSLILPFQKLVRLSEQCPKHYSCTLYTDLFLSSCKKLPNMRLIREYFKIKIIYPLLYHRDRRFHKEVQSSLRCKENCLLLYHPSMKMEGSRRVILFLITQITSNNLFISSSYLCSFLKLLRGDMRKLE